MQAISFCFEVKMNRMKILLPIILIFVTALGFGSVASARESEAALLKKARTLIDKKKNMDARLVFEQVIQKNPKSAEAIAGLAWTFYTQGERDRAEELAKKSLQIDNKIPMAHNVMGAIYFSKGQVEEAKNEFRTVLRLNPKQRCGGCSDLRGLLGNEIGTAEKGKKRK